MPQLELPRLEQRHLDLIGLGLVGLAAFFACIFYLDWDGGEVGEALAGGLRFAFGAIAYLVPVALLATGAVLIMRPALPNAHPFKTGALCLGAALTLGFAAGVARARAGGHAARRLPRRRLPRAPRRARRRLDLQRIEQALL